MMFHHVRFVVVCFFLVALCMLSMMIGPLGWSPPFFHALDDNHAIAFYRAGRILLCVVAGSSLAASGASLQAVFRNSLADPHLFGISGGAALGACIIIAFFSSTTVMPSIGAMVGGLGAFLVVLYYLQRTKCESLGHCLLVGVLINSIAGAIITVFKTVLPMHKTQTLLFWLVGHISGLEPGKLVVIMPLWIVGMIGLWLIKGELELLSFGVDESRLLGINAERVITIAIIANSILIGNVVSFAGMIGFLGLVIPHLCRLIFDANLRIMLPLASVMGAVALVSFDSLSRLSFLIIGTEIPTGALSALFLSPVFFFLLLRDRRYET